MRKSILAVATALVLVGCSSGNGRVVGTWKGKLIGPTNVHSLADFATGFLSAVAGDLTLEFNADGKYKESISIAGKTGTYSVSGDEVRLTPDDVKDKSQVLVLDGDELHVKKEFNSDPDIVFKRQAPDK